MSKAFFTSKTFLAAIVAIGLVCYQLYSGIEPGAEVAASIEANATKLLELVSLGFVLYGRAVAQGPLTLK